ncbi:G-protein coupled receptor 6-like [Branchiostoma floridae]|uniref:G-protein coupled receptor 6-like n=2 Tax=Branchiostoma floridae TaxID=7739 RepID=A0A9J7MKW8_BRAFL|nr:G-protein coupled receptor 6-like [Branchiostoma floridae]
MSTKGNYIRVAFVVLLATGRYVQLPLASGQDTAKETSNDTDTVHNSTDRNVNCSAFEMSTVSKVGENISSNASECVQSDSPSRTMYQSVAITIACVAITLGAWSFVANILPLAAIIRYEQLHTPVYILMANLAASDVLTGLTFMVGTGTTLGYIRTDSVPSYASARLMFTSMFLSGLSSAYSLMALTAERYWFIVHGMTYINNVTNDKCKVVTIIVWVWSGLLAMLPVFGWRCASYVHIECLPIAGGLPRSYVVVVLVFVFIPMAAIILLNMGVLWCLWKQVDAITAQEAAVGAQSSVNRKSGITLVIITILFLVGWMPIFSNMALFTHDFPSLYRMMVFIVLNSAINPVVYGFRLREVRRGVARLFAKSN